MFVLLYILFFNINHLSFLFQFNLILNNNSFRIFIQIQIKSNFNSPGKDILAVPNNR